MPRKLFNIEKFVTYDETTRKSTCLVATCKRQLCGKLKSNIKRHYRLVHKLNINTDDSDDSGGPETITIKEESIQEPIIEKGTTNTVEQEFIFEASNHEKDDIEETAQNVSPAPICPSKPNNFVDPEATSRENGNGFDDGFQYCDLVSNNDESEPPHKRKKILDDESAILNRCENFEDWVNRKKQLLEIEEIEMRNYKIKLELWEREQDLNLKCSKFTRDMKKFK